MLRCPHCGCNDCSVLQAAEPDAPLATGRAACGHCGRPFRFAAPHDTDGDEDLPDENGDEARLPRYRIVRERLRCPACHSTEFKTDTTRPESPDGSILRYHVCTRCSHRFSSLER
jgi:transcriptional regulator NrdR family protein